MADEKKSEAPPEVNKTVEQLREVFAPMAQRLTPDVEPALVYEPETYRTR